jgi:hypothetical protein
MKMILAREGLAVGQRKKRGSSRLAFSTLCGQGEKEEKKGRVENINARLEYLISPSVALHQTFP